MPPSPAHDEPEYRARRTRIDPPLSGQGWEVAPFDPRLRQGLYARHVLTEYPADHGPADHALFVTGRPLGIVEAKKVTLGPQHVLTQAERYSRGATEGRFNFRGYRVPLLYSTSGEALWFHDVRHELNRSRRAHTFHTPAALQEMLARGGHGP
jgi:type I restriction enzyme R subunit